MEVPGKQKQNIKFTSLVLWLHNVDLGPVPVSYSSYFACKGVKVALRAALHRATHCAPNGDHYSFYDDYLRCEIHPYSDCIAYYYRRYGAATAVIVLCYYPIHFVSRAFVGKIICILQPAHTNLLSMKYCIWKMMRIINEGNLSFSTYLQVRRTTA